jgi:hypothetical protein
MTDFSLWTVHGRLAVPVFFIAFVLLGYAPPILILFGLIDAAAAVWTTASLRKDSQAIQ